MEWISVKDRLPDDYENTVIMSVKIVETYGVHRDRKKTYHDIYAGYYDGEEWLTVWCYGCEYLYKTKEKFQDETIEVTHWMPLPEPPK